MNKIKLLTKSLINVFTMTFILTFSLHIIIGMSSKSLINGGNILKKEIGDLLGIATFTQFISDYMQYLDINYNDFWLDINSMQTLMFTSLIYALIFTILFLILGFLLKILELLITFIKERN